MESLPYLGAGLSYRWHLNAEIMAHRDQIDFLELTPEHFFPLNEDVKTRLAILSRRFPLIGHGLELSLATPGPLEADYLRDLSAFLSRSGCVWHGDHLCMTRSETAPIRGLTNVPFMEAAVQTTALNHRAAQPHLSSPLIVENIAYLVSWPMSVLDEATFLDRTLAEADCGWLLDLHNLYANARNHGFDPFTVLERLPLERVVQIHIAGGEEQEGLYFDTHSTRTPQAVWDLLEYVVPRCPVRGVNFEMDSRFPPFAELLEELAWARAILKRHGADRCTL